MVESPTKTNPISQEIVIREDLTVDDNVTDQALKKENERLVGHTEIGLGSGSSIQR